jgi:hypothetical protein
MSSRYTTAVETIVTEARSLNCTLGSVEADSAAA